jgi:hypothetical protein
MAMNEKEAREIIRTHWPGMDVFKYGKAKGYLEAIEKAKDVVETLKLFENYPCLCNEIIMKLTLNRRNEK